MSHASRIFYSLFWGLVIVKSGYSASVSQTINAIKEVKNNTHISHFNSTVHDAITSMSAAFQVKNTENNSACIIKDTRTLCLESDALASLPDTYLTADSIKLPAYIETIIYSQAHFTGSVTLLPLSFFESTRTISGMSLGSIQLIRKACLYYNMNYSGAMTCDYQDSDASGLVSLGIRSLNLASGIWIDIFQNADQSGPHIPFSKSIPNIVSKNYFATRPLSYKIHSQNEPVDLVKVNKTTQNLDYKLLTGNGTIMDFSTAGYMGGGVPRPTVLPVLTITPPEDPNADAALVIQQAINQQAKKPLINGFRNGGSIFLSAGTWNLLSSLTIKSSGIVLQGDPDGGTVLLAKGSPRVLIQIGATSGDRLDAKKYPITDAYVPLGATHINISDTSGLKSGDSISIQIPITAEWIALMGMDKLVRDGESQVWFTPGTIMSIDRTIKSVDSNTQITVDAALPQPIDAQYTQSLDGAYIAKYISNNRISQVGLEHIEAQAEFINLPISSPLWRFANMNHVVDSWMEDIKLTDFGAGAFTCNKRAQRITFNNLSIARTDLQPNDAGAASDINLLGSQILVRNASMSGPELDSGNDLNYFMVATGANVEGPNVILNMTQTAGNRGSIQPHMRWNSGFLVDNAVLPYGQIEFLNRGSYGSGHGWAVGYSMIWNSITNSFSNQAPPGSDNWAVGVIGQTGRQYFEGNRGTALHLGQLYSDIPSLYLYQLYERLGIDALRW